MAGQKIVVVRTTTNFEKNLESIESFWTENDYPRGFEKLLDELSETVIPNLEQFPGMGRPFLARRTESVEEVTRLKKMVVRVAKLDSKVELREYVMEEYLVLYAVLKFAVHWLAIRHHKQLSFDTGHTSSKVAISRTR